MLVLKEIYLKKKMKLEAQLSGYVSEHTGHHHGEISLQGAVNMAQDFVGSIPLLYPNGQFGTRLSVVRIVLLRMLTVKIILNNYLYKMIIIYLIILKMVCLNLNIIYLLYYDFS